MAVWSSNMYVRACNFGWLLHTVAERGVDCHHNASLDDTGTQKLWMHEGHNDWDR